MGGLTWHSKKQSTSRGCYSAAPRLPEPLAWPPTLGLQITSNQGHRGQQRIWQKPQAAMNDRCIECCGFWRVMACFEKPQTASSITPPFPVFCEVTPMG